MNYKRGKGRRTKNGVLICKQPLLLPCGVRKVTINILKEQVLLRTGVDERVDGRKDEIRRLASGIGIVGKDPAGDLYTILRGTVLPTAKVCRIALTKWHPELLPKYERELHKLEKKCHPESNNPQEKKSASLKGTIIAEELLAYLVDLLNTKLHTGEITLAHNHRGEITLDHNHGQ